MGAKPQRLYRIVFIWKRGEETGEATRDIRAESPKQAKSKLAALDEFMGSELDIIECKPIADSADEEPGPPEPQEPPKSTVSRVAEIMRAATEFADFENDGKKTEDEGTEAPPDDLDEDDEKGPGKLTRDEWKILRACAKLDENDADNGKRLLGWFGRRVLHVLESGWHVWTGTHWDHEAGQHAVERFAHLVVQRIKREAALISLDPSDAEVVQQFQELKEERGGVIDMRKLDAHEKALVKEAEEILKFLSKAKAGRYAFGVRTGDRSRTSAMIAQAEPHRSVLPAVLDQDDMAINCLNGTLRFMSVEDPASDPEEPRFIVKPYLHKHNPDDLLTKVAAAEYDPRAKCPTFLRDFERFMPDASTREFLQVFMGYVSLGVTGEQVYAFFYGDGGNWKSAFLQIIARTLGTYYKPMNYTSVTGNNMPSGDKPSPDWARLSGVRFLTIEEIPRKEPIKEELIKLVTSGTPLPVRHLNKGLFDLVAKFTCIMTSNAEPNISGHDQGIWRRTLIVPWDVSIPPEERLPFDKAMALYDRERSGVLNWLVEGALKYQENGLQCYITQRMREFTDSVRADRDAAGSFIDDCVKHAPGEFVTSGDLYKAFVRYCKANGIDPILNSTAFGRQVKRSEIEGVTMERRKHKVQGVRRFNDIQLHDVPDNPDDHWPGFP
jgi:putative DNA primase/helicase